MKLAPTRIPPLCSDCRYSSSETDTERGDTAARLRVQSLSVQLPGAPAALIAQCTGDLFVVVTVLENAQCDVGGTTPSCVRAHALAVS